MKIFKGIILILIAILSVYFCYIVFDKSKQEAELKSTTDIISDTGIQSLEEWDINGNKQWVSIRGQNRENPIILMVHGGPGSADMTMGRFKDFISEKYFVVVRWDQRNAGKSFSFLTSSGDLSPKTFIADVHAITNQLKTKLNREKIYIAGHSWGSIISAMAVYEKPEDYYAYIGIGQFVNGKQNEIYSYRYALREAVKDKNEIAIKELTEIGEPPYNGLQELGKEREWLSYYGGALFHGEQRKNTYQILGKMMIASPEYSLLDNLRFFAGVATSLFKVWPYVDAVDLTTQASSFKVPVYFLIGRFDYNTPWELSEQYFRTLKAPTKKYIWFKKSAHAPNYEEPENFGNALKMIKDETYHLQF
jgi:pimeloyl-ACP methyl ester carboxylesterase